MVGSIPELCTQIKNVLNDTSKLVDPLGTARTGNFVFGPDEELVFTRQMPKIQIDTFNKNTSNRTFGGQFKSQKTITLNIFFYTHKGDVDGTSGYKNMNLVYHYLDLIEETLKTHCSDITEATIIDIGTVDRPIRNLEYGIYYGFVPIIYSWVK